MSVNALREIFERIITLIVIALMIILAVEVTVGVIFRTINQPLAWYDEVAAVLLAWLTYYGAVLAALKRAHIAFPGIVNALPPILRVPVMLFTEACVIGFFALMTWYGWTVLGILGAETLVTVDIPVKVTQSVIPIGGMLFIIAELLCLPDILRSARREDSPVLAMDVANEVSH